MDINQVMSLVALVLANGTAVTVINQILKMPAVKVPAQRYPVPVAVLLSLIGSGVSVFMLHALSLDTWQAWLILSAATVFAATNIYDLVKKSVLQLQPAKDPASVNATDGSSR